MRSLDMVQQQVKSNQPYLAFVRLQEGWIASARIDFPLAVFIALRTIKPVKELARLLVLSPDHFVSMLLD
jgi:hypothetical protein